MHCWEMPWWYPELRGFKLKWRWYSSVGDKVTVCLPILWWSDSFYPEGYGLDCWNEYDFWLSEHLQWRLFERWQSRPEDKGCIGRPLSFNFRVEILFGSAFIGAIFSKKKVAGLSLRIIRNLADPFASLREIRVWNVYQSYRETASWRQA